MLKKSASSVLGSSKFSTYHRGYASGFDSPAALLDKLFEHPFEDGFFVPEVCHRSCSAEMVLIQPAQ
jgi:hypothetical protein